MRARLVETAVTFSLRLTNNMNEKIKKLIEQIETWNDDDKDALSEGSVPFDGTFVFAARQKVLDKLKKELQTH